MKMRLILPLSFLTQCTTLLKWEIYDKMIFFDASCGHQFQFLNKSYHYRLVWETWGKSVHCIRKCLDIFQNTLMNLPFFRLLTRKSCRVLFSLLMFNNLKHNTSENCCKNAKMLPWVPILLMAICRERPNMFLYFSQKRKPDNGSLNSPDSLRISIFLLISCKASSELDASSEREGSLGFCVFSSLSTFLAVFGLVASMHSPKI